jgi:hypothetical protein
MGEAPPSDDEMADDSADDSGDDLGGGASGQADRGGTGTGDEATSVERLAGSDASAGDTEDDPGSADQTRSASDDANPSQGVSSADTEPTLENADGGATPPADAADSSGAVGGFEDGGSVGSSGDSSVEDGSVGAPGTGDSGAGRALGDTDFRDALGPGCGLGRLPVSLVGSSCLVLTSLGCPGDPPPEARVVVNIASVRLDDGSAYCEDILDASCSMPYATVCEAGQAGGIVYQDNSRILRTVELRPDGASVVLSPSYLDGGDVTEGEDVVLEMGPCCREIVDVTVPVTGAVVRYVLDTQWALEDEGGEALRFGGLNQLELCPEALPEAGQPCPSQFSYQCRYPIDDPSAGCTGEIETSCRFTEGRTWTEAGEVCEDFQ